MSKARKKNDSTVGIFPRDITSLMLTRWLPNKRLIYLVVKNTPEKKWAKKFLKKEKVISYEIDTKMGCLTDIKFEDLLKYSNLAMVVKKNRIEALLTTSKYTDNVRKWSRDNDVKIISHPYWKYKKFENKLWFDKFLKNHRLPKPNSRIYRYPLSIPFKGKVVLQKSNSWGGEGTYYLKNQKEIKKLLELKEVKEGENYLLRQHILGKPYGITLFIAPGIVALSATRLQCFLDYPSSYRKIFIGIQWVPSNKLNDNIRKKIDNIFFKMGEIFYRKKFFGFFNTDFIIDQKGGIFLIECNPRFSAAATHELRFPKLISKINTGKVFIENSLKSISSNQRFKFLSFPDSSFCGSLLEVQLYPEKLGSKIMIKKEYDNAVYVYKKGRLKLKSFDIRRLSSKGKEFIFYSDARVGEIYTKFTTIATITSNFPLFDFKGNFNKISNKLLEKFKY